MKKIIYISISCILAILVIGGIILSHLNMIKEDFNKSDYKHIKIKSSWDKIYCDSTDSRLVCAKTKDGYMEIYDYDLNYIKKVKLPEFKNIRIYDKEIVIVKPDGTVWYCNTEKDNEFKNIDYLSDVEEIYPSYFYWIYKDKKGDFYSIENQTINDFIDNIEIPDSVMKYKTPKLIKNLKDAEILSFDTTLVYKKDGNTYAKFYYVSKEKLLLFDEDNNVTFDKCIEGVTYEKAFNHFSRFYLYDSKNRIGCINKKYNNIVQTFGPVDTKIKIDKIASNGSISYLLDIKGKLYDAEIYKNVFETPEISKLKLRPIFKYKKFKNIYSGCYLYATDDKYLYKLDK